MYNLIFQDPNTAKLLDLITLNPKEGYALDQLAKCNNLAEQQVKIALRPLQVFNFVEQKEDGKFYLKKNDITSAYILSDLICRRENSENIHDLFENGNFNLSELTEAQFENALELVK